LQASILGRNEVIFQKHVGSWPPLWSIQDSLGNKIGQASGFIDHHHLAFRSIDNVGQVLSTSLQTKTLNLHGEFVISNSDGSELARLRRKSIGVGIGMPLVFTIEQNGQDYLQVLGGVDGDIWKRNYQMVEMGQVPVAVIRKIIYTWTELKFSVSITGDVDHLTIISSIPPLDYEIDLLKGGRGGAP
jgi:uncharacterized protein YxjI